MFDYAEMMQQVILKATAQNPAPNRAVPPTPTGPPQTVSLALVLNEPPFTRYYAPMSKCYITNPSGQSVRLEATVLQGNRPVVGAVVWFEVGLISQVGVVRGYQGALKTLTDSQGRAVYPDLVLAEIENPTCYYGKLIYALVMPNSVRNIYEQNSEKLCILPNPRFTTGCTRPGSGGGGPAKAVHT